MAEDPEGPSPEERLLNNMKVNEDLDETANGTSPARDALDQEEPVYKPFNTRATNRRRSRRTK